MAQRFRLSESGLIDRSETLPFTFEGRRYEGHPGDSLASALLANGVHFVARSFKYHRPRGIFAAGAEEPNALVQLGEDARTEPNLRATQIELYRDLTANSQHCWPSLDFDIGGVNDRLARFFPAGFYYKTFMWPASMWMKYEAVIRQAAGLGTAPSAPDPDSYDKTFAHADLLVVGGGPAGLMAALTAARTGARVVLAEQEPLLGGWLLSSAGLEIEGQPALDWVAAAEAELQTFPGVTLLKRTQCFGVYDHNFFTLNQRVTDHLPLARRDPSLPRQRLWKLRAKQAVFATGAIERPLVFRDNDRPGIMLAGAAQTYVRRYAVKPGERAVVFTNNDGGYAAALALQEAGTKVAAVVDLRETPEGPLTARAQAAGLDIFAGHAVIGTEGGKRISGCRIAPLDESGKRVFGGGTPLDCDLLISSGGWSPTVHLFAQAKGKLIWDEAQACFVPGEAARPDQRVVGAANGAFDLTSGLAQGQAAGQAAAADAGFKVKGRKKAALAKITGSDAAGFLPARFLYLVPSDRPLGQGGKHFVDLQNDVTASDLELALREGYGSIEHVKRYTTTGMGTDQGKTGNVNAIGVVAERLGRPLPDVGVTTFRLPYTPVTFGIFAGRDVDELLDPVRTTPMQAWHKGNGAVFEDVGQWKRPWYFPKAGEDMQAAVQRECKAVRASLGLLDASTLGKIDIQGPDAAVFLNRIYSNAWSKLAVGRCRYGLMLKEDGMVMDDGVTARLGERHYLMSTTTGNAAAVLAHLEEWLQTEWPTLKVYLTSVTEQWATLQLAGPNARKLLGRFTDLDLSPEAFGFMEVKNAEVMGIPARIFRISFTGELSYEINVPASYGHAVWEAFMRDGETYGITPFGTETMHVLRAEKGFIIVGQETDGSVTPLDLGLEGLCSKTKDFVGKRSLARPDMERSDRKQLVGLETDDPAEVLPEGAQLTETIPGTPRPVSPVAMAGHVTSSYMSPNLGRSLALALIKGGRDRLGQRLYAPLADGRTIVCKVVSPVFYDPEGERMRA
ncbi:sarcosine oxidase subunit alpha family protein [Algihabitans albus]|uniref:sarcosine oxidase subunit alpha family protein n=1 Tax=Algihabitans albus TaxID=2164067 RepID=UPI000E5CDC98|nr:sarcosine oxidase subunit alpha family protein [Algihabitans albus]